MSPEQRLQNAFLTDASDTPNRWRAYGWAAIITVLSIWFAYFRGNGLDGYDYFVLVVCAFLLIALGMHWQTIQIPSIIIASLTALSFYLHGGNSENADTVFLLKYFFSSQSAIGWMCALYLAVTPLYAIAGWYKSRELSRWARCITWTATIFGIAGLLIRWFESYLINPEYGHIPVSNLYEVFVLFCVISALIYLYYERALNLEYLGAFAMIIISAAVIFTLWYANSRGADQIQPLIPALKSYWMKLHVPSNFIGYGCFALAAMMSVAYLLSNRFPAMGADQKLLNDVIYRLIALGFAFFTIATILGALWAAEAWGNYWSWDPKETWALIVWLNYAAWLHYRLNKGLKGNVLAWWAIIGLFITLFAFIGVNMFLSGLHSYGEL